MSITALWPASPIRSHVTEVLGIEPKLMREPDIFADACLAIASDKSDRFVKLNTISQSSTNYLDIITCQCPLKLITASALFCRLNGKCLIDEDYLRSIQIVDFKKYRCNPKFEPPRMMPKKFPSLLVDEED